MNTLRSVLTERLDLEKRFMLWLAGLLAAWCVAYAILAAERSALLESVLLIASAGGIIASIAHYVLFKPIRRLADMAKAIGAGDLSGRLRFERDDDIGTLAHELDAMCDQLEQAQRAAEAHIAALEQLRHSDRVATLGRLASSVAHELGNPLNVIELRAQLITSGDVTTLEQAQQSAAVIVEQTHRMTGIIDEILSFARVRPAKLARVDLVGVVRKAIVLCQHTAKIHKTKISLEVPKTVIEVDGDADKLLQIVVNLVINGVQATTNGGALRVSMCEEQAVPDENPTGALRAYVCICVVDHGVGMSREVMSKVFEPFFSTRSAEGGTGLGLSVAQGIAREHDGWISASSEPGQGSVFKVYLPKLSPKGDHAHAS